MRTMLGRPQYLDCRNVLPFCVFPGVRRDREVQQQSQRPLQACCDVFQVNTTYLHSPPTSHKMIAHGAIHFVIRFLQSGAKGRENGCMV